MNMKHSNVANTLGEDNLAMLWYNALLIDKTTMNKPFILQNVTAATCVQPRSKKLIACKLNSSSTNQHVGLRLIRGKHLQQQSKPGVLIELSLKSFERTLFLQFAYINRRHKSPACFPTTNDSQLSL